MALTLVSDSWFNTDMNEDDQSRGVYHKRTLGQHERAVIVELFDFEIVDG
jgi:hypothetical protein